MGNTFPPCALPEADPWELEQEPPTKSSSQTPLLLHFDVNKTILLSDSLIMKSIEDGIREGISELFWGVVHPNDTGAEVWEWTGTQPSVDPPTSVNSTEKLRNYQQFCKAEVSDKDERKKAMRSFSLVTSENSKNEMEKWVRLALQKMELPKEVVHTQEAQASGLKGSTFVMLPAFFHLVSALQDQGRKFAIVFRSFGDDHEKIKTEWNSFCELRHPVFSKLVQGTGPLDGSAAHPDRRIHEIHTLYRDDRGPMLILGTFTNGPSSAKWDAWAKSKPKPKEDTRKGRDFVREELGSSTVDGVPELQTWLHQVLKNGETAAIKDDWAWWQFHGEQSMGGKLLPLIGGEDTQQIFFDDNVEIDDPRIVDCRYPDGTAVPAEKALNRLCIKVNPVEALIDKFYFLRKLDKVERLIEGTREGLDAFNPFGRLLQSVPDLLCCRSPNAQRIPSGEDPFTSGGPPPSSVVVDAGEAGEKGVKPVD